MKKLILTLTILMMVVVGYFYRERTASYVEHIESQYPQIHIAIEEVKGIIETQLDSVEKEVITPEPLRILFDNPNAFLTVKGTIQKTNEHRSALGFAPLAENEFLNAAAARKIQDMFDQQYFEHVSPEGIGAGVLIEGTGYQYVIVGENLALGNYADDTELVQAWMDSPGHRENILHDQFTEIGVAVGKGVFEGRTTWLAVQEFGRPLSSCPTVDTILTTQIDASERALEILSQQIKETQDELSRTNPILGAPRQEVDRYNQEVKRHNQRIAQYNEKLEYLKSIIAKHNEQVKAFNACIAE